MNTPVPTRIFTADSTGSTEGKGTVDRKENLQTNVAAVVTQLLPNGNYLFQSGFINPGSSVYDQAMEVTPGNAVASLYQAQSSSYRGWRLRDLYSGQ